MQELSEIIREQQRSRGPHDDPLTDSVIAELLRLAEEICVLRDRLDSCQRLVEAGEAPDVAAIDAYSAPVDVIEQRLANHQAFFREIFERLNAAGKV